MARTFESRPERSTRSSSRPALITTAAAARAARAAAANSPTAKAASAAEARAEELAVQSAKTTKKAKALAKRAKAKKAKAKKAKAEEAASDGAAVLPVGKYSLSARFGQVGSWSRYHTGFDFAASIGTAIRAPEAGKVTHAGSGGSAGGWAGTYVTVQHADGTSSLYAHMSTVSVHAGQTVSGGQNLGQIGMTGRSFGPHLHFEIYPAGVEPGDPYSAVNPEPWLRALGLTP